MENILILETQVIILVEDNGDHLNHGDTGYGISVGKWRPS